MEDQDAYVKDLSRLGRDLKDVIIIDNSPTSYYLQPENALASKSWYDEYDDRELFTFIPLLEQLSTFPDVRPTLTQIALEACDQIGRDIVVLTDLAAQIVSKQYQQLILFSHTSSSDIDSIFDRGLQQRGKTNLKDEGSAIGVGSSIESIIQKTFSSANSLGRDQVLLNNWIDAKNIKYTTNLKNNTKNREGSNSAQRYLEAAKNIASL